MSGLISIIAGIVVLYGLVRLLKRSPGRKPAEAAAPEAGGNAAALPAPMPAKPDRGLEGQPIVERFDDMTMEAHIHVSEDRVDIIDALEQCGALDANMRSENSRIAHLDKIPADLVRKISGNPEDDLEIYVTVYRHVGATICNSFGNIAKIERDFNEWLSSAPGWQKLVQERGSFIEGQFFTEDVLLQMESGYLDRTVQIGIISRAMLRQAVEEKLHLLRSRLQA